MNRRMKAERECITDDPIPKATDRTDDPIGSIDRHPNTLLHTKNRHDR
jgi:hypothetical protein